MYSTLKINYVHFKEVNFSYEFLHFKEKVSKDAKFKEWKISDEYFNKNMETLKICFIVSSGKIKRKFYVDLFYGINNWYLFIDNLGKSYQLFFKNLKDIIIVPENSRYSINTFDSNETLNRKRIVLINYCYDYININETIISLNSFLPPRKNSNFSFNYSFYDLTQKLILSKVYKGDKKLNFEKKINKIKPIILKLFTSLTKLNQIETEDEYKLKYSKIKKYNLKKFKFHLNISKEILETIINDNFLNFEYKKEFVFIILNFRNNIPNISLNDYKDLCKFVFNNLNKISNDKDLTNYQKLFIIEQFTLCCSKFNNIKEFINCDFEYYIISKAETNSILFFVYQFIKQFIKDLKEEHKAFYKLLEIDGGVSYYKGNGFYSFDLKNLKEIKSHLNEIMGDIICFYNNDDISNCSFCSKNLKYATINKKNLPKISNIKFDKTLNENNIIEGKKIAIKIIINYFHEIPGHIKFGFSNYEYINSPNKCVDKNNNIQTLVPFNENKKGDNIIKILAEGQKSDSGSFFELIYGKEGETYIKDLMDSSDCYWKIIDRVDLFLQNISILSKYIRYKIIFEHFKLKDDLTLTIEDEITVFLGIERPFFCRQKGGAL